MVCSPLSTPPTLEEAAGLSPQEVVDVIGTLQREMAHLKRQIDWFRRQIFGHKSERRIVPVDTGQMSLGEGLTVPETGSPPLTPTQAVAAHHRHRAAQNPDAGAEPLPFFDADRVPMEVITLASPETEGLAPEEFEVIGTKETFRLAQRPGSYVVIKYIRPLIKRRADGALCCPAAPAGVIEGSRADVSFLAGLLIDKFAYHLPLYRQHQRLMDAGFRLSRPWLTQLARQAIGLLEPIYEAQLASIGTSHLIIMDETPIKAGRAGPGQMKQGYFWPVYGTQGEVCFPYRESRRHEHVAEILGTLRAGTVLLSDGYSAYARYTARAGLTHAQCWAHTRRLFYEAQSAEPEGAGCALAQIGALYAVEKAIRDLRLTGAEKHDYRLRHAQPIVERFFAWIDRQFEAQGLLPTNPLTTALAYARERRPGLTVFLADPDVPVDTNVIERALRPIPMGRRSWLFCWTELGAHHVGIVQSLIATCRLHGVDPYDYLVDVLQRVATHPAAAVSQLTPRLWKPLFAAHPLRSDLHRIDT